MDKQVPFSDIFQNIFQTLSKDKSSKATDLKHIDEIHKMFKVNPPASSILTTKEMTTSLTEWFIKYPSRTNAVNFLDKLNREPSLNIFDYNTLVSAVSNKLHKEMTQDEYLKYSIDAYNFL